jgi:DegV family protein with EDD domain
MSNVCILTDSTAQFIQPNFPGHERVTIIPFDLQMDTRQGGIPPESRAAQPHLIPPSPQDFSRYYTHLGHKFDSILVLTLSSLLSPTMNNAISASMQTNNNSAVEVVDSQTAATGLGMLVQIAAGAADEGVALAEISRRVRVAIPHIYALFCIPDLMYLARGGHMDHAQAMVGEIMGMLPIFTLEEGRLVPMEKVRTPRHLFEAFQDFIGEFESPNHIALVHGTSHNTLRTRPLLQYMQEFFPETPFSEHPIQPHLAVLFGPQSIGLVISEGLE